MRTCCHKGIVLLMTFILPAFTACSVKENRAACPCYASILVDDFILAGFSEALLSVSADRLVCRDDIRLREYEDGGYEATLGRNTNRVSLVSGLQKMTIKGDSLVVAYGMEADPIWLYSEKFFCREDSYIVRARPHKQYCRLEIVLKGLSAEDRSSCSFRVKAACCGLDIYSRTALEGEYAASAERGLDGNFSVRVPRQNGGGLLVEAYNGIPGEEPLLIDAGKMLRSAGYDWSREDLRDVSITVDYAKAEVSLRILDWNPDDIYKDIII